MKGPVMPADPPFPDTTFICRDIMRATDPTAFTGLTYVGEGEREVWDWRVGGGTRLTFVLYNATYDDGMTVEVRVERDTFKQEAKNYAEKYSKPFGQLPTGVRTRVKALSIMTGNQAWGGGLNDITIHSGLVNENTNELEETLLHEAAHTSLGDYNLSAEWKAAQQADNTFISVYARGNPEREDVAESYVAYVAIRYRVNRISKTDADKIVRAIPNRIAFFDAQQLPMAPMPPLLKLIKATASSELSAPYNDKPQTATRLIEGPNSGDWFWNSDNQGRDPTPWFSLQLEHRSIVDALYIRWKRDYGSVGARPMKFKVLSSVDGTSWSETGIDQSWVKAFSPNLAVDVLPGWAAPTQYIKLEMSDSSYGQNPLNNYISCRYVLVTGKPS
jgi:hypothetical protein